MPFKPRPGSEVLCRDCFSTKRNSTERPDKRRSDFRSDRGGPVRRGGDRRGGDRRDGGRRGGDRRDGGRRNFDRRDGGHRGGDRRGFDGPERPERPTWDITCAGCGAEDQVPFKPREGSEVFCRDCHENRKGKRQLQNRYNRPERGTGAQDGPHVPRLDHGTRVMFPIDCEHCGRHEVLSYVPKTTGPVLCSTCREDQFGRSWYQVKQESEQNQQYNVRSKRRRVVEIITPNPDRLEDFEPVNTQVKIRKR